MSGPTVTLTHCDGADAGRVHELEVGVFVIGRGDEADITVEDKDASRRHARVEILAGGARITDLRSKNGVTVDDEVIEPDTVVELNHGARIGIGAIRLELSHPAARLDRVLAAGGEVTVTRTARSSRAEEAVPDLKVPAVATLVFAVIVAALLALT